MATWDAAYELTPAGTDSPALGAAHFKDVKTESRSRMNQEHVWLDTASTGASIHRQGSAVAYFQVAAPTTRPDGVTSFGTGDTGRLWVDSNNSNLLTVYDHTSTSFETISVGALDATANYTVTDLTATGNVAITGSLSWDGAIANNVILAATYKLSTGGEAAPDCAAGGICLNVTGATFPSLSVKSSAVAHGMTDIAETDTAGYLIVASGAGGIVLRGLTETGTTYATWIWGVAGSEDTTTTTAAYAPTMTNSSKKNATGSATIGSTGNIFVAQNSSSAKFIVKGDGDIYYDGADQGAYDDENDFGLIQSANHPEEQGFLRERLEELGVMQNGFISVRRMARLQNGALCKIIGMLWDQQARLERAGL